MSAPAGWTLVESVSGSAREGAVWVKVAAGEGASYTFTLGASHNNGIGVGIVAYEGVGTTLDDSSIAAGIIGSAPTIISESTPFAGPGADRSISVPAWQVDDLIVFVSAGQRIGGIADYTSVQADGNTMTQEVSFQSDTSGGTTRSLRVWLYWWRATYAASSVAVVADHPLSTGLGSAYAKALVIRGAKATGNPFTTATASDNSASTAITFPTVSAAAGSLVLQLMSHGESSGSADTPGVVSGAGGFSNSDLTGFTANEYIADPTTSNEQAVALLSGEAPSGGTVGATTATSTDSTAAESLLTAAIAPTASPFGAVAPAVTTLGANRFVLFYGLIQSNGSNLVPDPAGWTSRISVSESGGPANTQDGITVYEKAYASAGSTGAIAATAASAYGGHVCGLVAFPDTMLSGWSVDMIAGPGT